MSDTLDDLCNQYDRGVLSRRQLLQGLLVIAATSGAQAQAPAPAVVGRTVNHVQIMVADLAVSRAFYGALAGTEKVREINPDTWVLAMRGNLGLITLRRSPERRGVVDHFGIGVDDFDAQKAGAAVKRMLPATNVEISPTGISLRDPDGILVQMASKNNEQA